MSPRYRELARHGQRPLSRHVRMSRRHRAKQFAPFAALKGYEEALHRQELAHALRSELPAVPGVPQTPNRRLAQPSDQQYHRTEAHHDAAGHPAQCDGIHPVGDTCRHPGP